MDIQYDHPVLTLSQVRGWQSRAGEIAIQVRDLQAESVDISRKLDAVKVIMGSLPSDDDISHAAIPLDVRDAMQAVSDGAFQDVVIQAVGSIHGIPKAGEIKRWIIDHADSFPGAAEKANRPYFYTILMRHAQNGRLIKEGDGYRLPTSSPEGETEGPNPPVLAQLNP